MSIYRTDYVIYGYDFSAYKDELDELLEENNVIESYIAVGDWCIFSDFFNDSYCYFGYCLAEICHDEEDISPMRMHLEEIETVAFSKGFSSELVSIFDELTLKHPEMLDIRPQLIVFSDWR